MQNKKVNLESEVLEVKQQNYSTFSPFETKQKQVNERGMVYTTHNKRVMQHHNN